MAAVVPPLRRCTPIVLTWNEAPNLARCLASVTWAERVLVLDSGSTDQTEAIARAHANVRWEVRRFDTHAAQWDHAVRQVAPGHVAVALDADMVVPASFLSELERFIAEGHSAGEVSFSYCVAGRTLRGSLYPPQVRVFRPEAVTIRQDGHTQRFEASSPVHRFASRWIHDDRKPVERWIQSQVKYSRLEADRLRIASSSGVRDRLRATGLMPPLAGTLAWLRAGGPFGGGAALRYALERSTFEALLALRLLERPTPRSTPEGVQ